MLTVGGAISRGSLKLPVVGRGIDGDSRFLRGGRGLRRIAAFGFAVLSAFRRPFALVLNRNERDPRMVDSG
jgi:hypothetical protein